MTKKFTRRCFFVAVILAVVLCLCSAFSVSYAKWQAPGQNEMPCSLGIGVWGNLNYTLVTKNGDVALTESNGTYTATFKAKPDDTVELKLSGGTVAYPVKAGTDLVQLDGNSYKVLKAHIYDNMTTVVELSYTITVTGKEASFTVDTSGISTTDPTKPYDPNDPGLMDDILGGQDGIVTSSGQVIKFDGNKTEITLEPGESFTLYLDGKVVSKDSWGGTWGGASVNIPDSMKFEGTNFTASEGGTYTVSYEKRQFILEWFHIDVEPTTTTN